MYDIVHREEYRGHAIRIHTDEEESYTTGDPAWGFIIAEDANPEESIDSCWAFDDLDHCIATARETIDLRHTEDQVAQNWHINELADGTALFYSYKQLIGLKSPKLRHTFHGWVYTDEKFSATTSRHLRACQDERGGEIVPAKAFALIRREVGV